MTQKLTAAQRRDLTMLASRTKRAGFTIPTRKRLFASGLIETCGGYPVGTRWEVEYRITDAGRLALRGETPLARAVSGDLDAQLEVASDDAYIHDLEAGRTALTDAQRKALEHYPAFPVRQLTAQERAFAKAMRRNGWLSIPENPNQHCALTDAGRDALRGGR